jgi:hypothetical protein
MSEPALRFSLRSLFMATTLIAILFSTVAIHPAVLIASLVLLSQVLFVVVMAICANHSSAVKRVGLAMIGTVLFLLGASIGIAALQSPGGSWILVGLLLAGRFACYSWAWNLRTP